MDYNAGTIKLQSNNDCFVGNALILHFTFKVFIIIIKVPWKKFLKLDESVIDGLHALLLRNFND